MRSKIAMLCLTMLVVPGCSLLKPNPGGGDPQTPEDWNRIAPVIEARVRIVTKFAFSLNAVKPYKEKVCDFGDDLAEFLDAYNDKDASFEKLQAEASRAVARISDERVRKAVDMLVDLVFTETFNYAWQNYQGFIDQDQPKIALILSRAIADGLRGGCDRTISIMGFEAAPQVTTIFTVPKD